MDNDDAIAIVGVGGMFPGADNIEEFWRVLVNGENHVIEIPPERWNVEEFFDSDPDVPGKTYVRRVGFLKKFDEWDNRMFGVSDAEAARMDPQQRYVLDCVHMALEDGGITRKQIDGSNTGVYVGVMNDDYKSGASDDISTMNNYSLTGTAPSIIAARISYVFNLLGPALSLDTACSSSLVAIHLAIQAMKSGECDMTICGGVNSILYPQIFVPLSKGRMVSPTGQSQAFSDTADGYARGEGCGMLVLKKLGKAKADGNKIWAVLATGINQDGHTMTPITAPSGSQQTALLQKVYGEYNVDPLSIQYIEAHGTGTPVGDPIEANSLGEFFREGGPIDQDTKNRLMIESVKRELGMIDEDGNETEEYRQKVESGETDPNKLFEGLMAKADLNDASSGNENATVDSEERIKRIKMGSVKTNIGHLESAAGVAGIIKVLLMMKHGKFVPSLHYRNANPKINFKEFEISISTSVSDWQPNKEGCRLACVNSFGFGGTNSHGIIMQLPKAGKTTISKVVQEDPKIIVMSSHNASSLKTSLEYLIQNLEESEYSIEDLAYTSVCRRDHYMFRMAFSAATQQELLAVAKSQLPVVKDVRPPGVTAPNVIFVFCGVGTTWNGMCREMIHTEPVFAEAVRNVDNLLTPYTGWSIYTVLQNGEDVVEDALKGHLAIFTCQVATAALWKHWGIVPNGVVGQSVGEVAAAYVAGVFPLDVAVRIIFHRSEILSKATGGKMMVVSNYSLEDMNTLLQKYQGRVNIAVYSSSTSFTLSGDTDAIEEIRDELKGSEVGSSLLIRELNAKCAYHSHHVNACGEILEGKLDGMSGSEPKLKLYSTVSGELAKENDFCVASYWKSNVKDPVDFSKAIKASSSKNTFNVFIEIGPRPVLRAHFNDMFTSSEAVCLPSMKSNADRQTIRATLADTYRYCMNPNLELINGMQHQLTDLPKYVPCRSKLLFESEQTRLKNLGISRNVSMHPFIKRKAGDGAQFDVIFSTGTTPYVYEHKVADTIIVPGALYAEVALEVAKHLMSTPLHSLEISVDFKHPLSLSAGKSSQAEVWKEESGFEIYRNRDFVAKFSIKEFKEDGLSFVDVNRIKDRCPIQQPASDIYSVLGRLGFSYGEELKILGKALRSDMECLVEMELSEMIMKDISNTNIHPAVLDGLLQTPGCLQNKEMNQNVQFLPGGIGKLVLKRPPEKYMYAYMSLVSASEDEYLYNALLLKRDGTVIAEIKEFAIRSVASSSLPVAHKIIWSELHASDSSDTEKREPLDLTVISFEKEVINKVQNIFPEDYVSHILIDREPSDNALDIFGNNFDGPSKRILFVPRHGPINDQISGEDLFQTVFDHTSKFIGLLQYYARSKCKVPIYVLTRNVQCVNEENPCELDLLGAELWGVVRSALREQDMPLYLVNVSPDLQECSAHIKEIILGHDSSLDVPELSITQDKIFQNEFIVQPIEERSNAFRIAKSESDTQVQIKSKRPTDLDNIFYTPQTDIVELSSSKEIYFKIQKAVVHSDSLFAPTYEAAIADISLWPSDNKHGYSALTFEATGMSMDKNGKKKDNIIACYPLRMSTLSKVPRECCCKLEDIPHYVPGFLRTCVILWEIVQRLPEKKDTCIVTDANNGLAARVLQAMLESRKSHRITILNTLEIEEAGVQEASVVIPLTKMDLRTVGRMLLNFPSLKHLVSLRMYLSLELIRFTNDNSLDVNTVSVCVDDIFTRARMEREVPKIMSWVKKRKSYLSSILSGHTETFNGVFLPSETKLVDVSCEESKTLRIPENLLFRKNATYVVIGGMTGLGWELLLLLAERGAGYIISISRRLPSDEKSAEISELSTRLGCQIIPLQADVTDFNTLQQAFDNIEMSIPCPIKGIFQGAGILDDSPFPFMTKEKIERVMKPKVLGTWNLHQVSRNLPLDFFIMHSSMTSVMGNPGQCNYGAGNAFMDALAQYRRSRELSGQSINWGPLAVGMAKENPGIEEALSKRGYMTLHVPKIRSCFIEILRTNATQLTYGMFDWKIIGHDLSAASHLVKHKFRKLLESRKERGSADDMDPSVILEKILAMPEEERPYAVIEILHRLAGDVFAVDPSLLKAETQISALGIDSMLAMTFVNTVQAVLGCRISVVALFSEETTFRTLADMVLESILNGNEVEKTMAANVPESMTPYEKRAYEGYLRNPEDPSLYMFGDIEVPMFFAKPLYWRTLIQGVHTIHEGLRTLFVPEDEEKYRYGVRRVVMDPADVEIDFREVPMSYLTHKSRHPPNPDDYIFDPAKDLPMRTFFAKKGMKCLMRVVFNHAATDLSSIWMIMNDMNPRAMVDKENDKPKEKSGECEEIDIAVLVEKRLLKEEENLQMFWFTKVPRVLYPMTLGTTGTIETDPDHFEFQKISLPKSVVSKIPSILKSNTCTLFHLMATLFQLMLYSETRNPVVSVMTTMDLRSHFEEMKRVVNRFTNRIPLFLTVEDKNMKVAEVLQRNKRHIVESYQNGHYPFLEIKKAVTKIAPEEVFRHQIVMEDTSTSEILAQDKKAPMRVRRMQVGNYYNETIFYVWHDLNSNKIDLELGFSTLMISSARGRKLVEGIEMMMKRFVENPGITLEEMTTLNHYNPSKEFPFLEKRLIKIKNTNGFIESDTAITEQKNVIDAFNSSSVNGHANQTNGVNGHTGSTDGINGNGQPIALSENGITQVESNDVQNGDGASHAVHGQVVCKEHFLKQTSSGWEHPVYLLLGTVNEGQEQCIKWGTRGSRGHQNTLLLSDIIGLEITNFNDYRAFILKTADRDFVFKTNNEFAADAWSDLFKSQGWDSVL